jgi:uncharacterized protein YkwD
MKGLRHHFIMAVALAVLPPARGAEPDGKLLELINAYRADPPPCEGARREPLPPLAPESSLARLKINGGGLQDAMRAAGYQASRAESLTMTGPTDAAEAMRFAVQHYCRLLLSGRYSVAGVSRQGSKWIVVLAQPRLDPDLGDWRDAGHRILKQVNAARAGERRCGNRRFEPAPPLRWSAALGAAALRHSRDMAEHSFFGHQGRDGNTVDTRAADEGYAWRSVGENVAAGQGSPRQVVDGWLSSPGHCANIMNGSFTEMGAAYAINPESDATIYWTQVFGSPR